MKNIKRIILSIILLASSCSSSSWLLKDFETSDKNYEKIPLHLLSVGDSKSQVVQSLGDPEQVMGSTSANDSTIVEVWSYERWMADIGQDYKTEEYYLYFLNGKLAQWGRPGDWRKVADEIIEVRFR
jgi:hypothetical protein